MVLAVIPGRRIPSRGCWVKHERMDAVSPSRPSFADQALEQLREWPALNACRADCGAGMGLAVSTRQIVHLHQPDEAELYLTWPVIQRLRPALAGSEQVQIAPGSDWVRLRLDCTSDVRLLVSLVSVAIKASAPARSQRCQHRRTPCPQARRAHMPGR
jgi:Luciferase